MIGVEVPAWLPLARAMPERALQECVRQCALLHGWLYYHTHRSQHSPAGFPDVIAARGRVLLVAELKRMGKQPSAAQWLWLETFEGLGAEMHVWTPEHWYAGEIERALTAREEG